MFNRAVSERTLPGKNSGTTLPYRTQSVCCAPEQWMPNALLSTGCDVGGTLLQGHCHFLLKMWRSCYPAVTVMRDKRRSDGRMSTEEAIREICKNF